jgi:hypothetical protein
MKEPHHRRKVGYGMIMVAASLSLIGLLQITIGEDVLFADKIQRQQVAVFEDCKANDFQEPECARWLDEVQIQKCIDNRDVDSAECWKYRTWVIAHAEQELLLSEKENLE